MGVLLGSAASAEPNLTRAEVAQVVRELEVAVLKARARLLDLVAMQRAPGSIALHDEPELRELASELPELERELERWARFEPRPPSPAAP